MVEHEKTSVLKGAPRWLWTAAAIAPVIALLVLLDAAPLLYPEKIPISIKAPMRLLIERDPLIAGVLPSPVLWVIWALGAVGVFCLIDYIAIGISRVLMVMLAILLIIMAYEVYKRYVVVDPTRWVFETTIWIAGALYLTSGIYVLQQRSHIRIYMLYDIIPRWVQRVFDLISTVLLLLFAAAVVYGGFNEMWRKLLRWELYGTEWNPPIPATVKLLILVSVVLIAMQSLSNLICDWRRPKQTHDLLDEVSGEVEAIKRAALKDEQSPTLTESR